MFVCPFVSVINHKLQNVSPLNVVTYRVLTGIELLYVLNELKIVFKQK